MSAHPQPSPSGGVHPHHGPLAAHPQINGHMPIQSPGQKPMPAASGLSQNAQKVIQLNESVWMQIGNLTEMMGDLDGAMNAYEQALRHNQYSIPAMSALACVLRTRENFHKAIEYLQSILKLDPQSGESWGSLGHCYLMIDNLQEAYSAYQQALYHLRDPKEPKLWYGIGILYDRYGSLEHAEEAFTQVMRMQQDFEKANEIYFRLGIIYKQQQKFDHSLDCFKYIVTDPPRPLTEEDIWFQIGHVHEQQKDFDAARGAYERVLDREPNHAKVLQQLGWLYHQQSNSYSSQEKAIEYLEKSVSADNREAQSWYLLGRCYMSQQKYPKAYEAYQQAVYRDGRNPTFWCSIGVLYYQINQYRDALDAYSRAIRLNPYISEVWYDLGTLYESCNNQTNDALDAYNRAAELDPGNAHIKARLQLLKSGKASSQGAAPMPRDVHPHAYQPTAAGAPAAPQWGAPAPTGGPPPQGPAPPGRIPEWGRPAGVSDGPPQQPLNHVPSQYQYDHHPPADAGRGPPQHSSPREQAGPESHAPPPPGRKRSPSPKFNLAAPQPYAGPQSQTLPQLGPLPQQGERPNGPGYSQQSGQGPPAHNAPNGASNGPVPAYGRSFTPPAEARPRGEERPISPGSTYPQHAYGPAPAPASSAAAAAAQGAGASGPGPAVATSNGGPPGEPTSAVREREERPTSAMKRSREWEGEPGPSKKQANDDTRSRLEEPQSSRRMSPTRLPSPQDTRGRRSSSADKREEKPSSNNGANNGNGNGSGSYHPSEAAHGVPTLPSIQHMQQPSQQGSKMAPMGEASAALQTGPLPGIQASIPSASGAPTASAPSQSTPERERERDRDRDVDREREMERERERENDREREREREKDKEREREREKESEKERERKDEPPARKMDVDEDYDDEEGGGDEEKKAGSSTTAEAAPKAASPTSPGAGPSSGLVNGSSNQQTSPTKAEASA